MSAIVEIEERMLGDPYAIMIIRPDSKGGQQRTIWSREKTWPDAEASCREARNYLREKGEIE